MSHSDKDNEEEKQTKGRAETKQKYEKEKRKRCFFPNRKMLLNSSRQHIKRDQHLPVLVFSLLPGTNYLQVQNQLVNVQSEMTLEFFGIC